MNKKNYTRLLSIASAFTLAFVGITAAFSVNAEGDADNSTEIIPTESVVETVEPTEEATEPSEEATEPTESVTESTESVTETPAVTTAPEESETETETTTKWEDSFNLVYYYAGDVENMISPSTFSLPIPEGCGFEFAEKTRFSRVGYELSCWYVESEDKYAGFGQSYIMGAEDIYVTAVWQPINYIIGFAGLGGVTSDGESNIYTDADYDTTITLPENTFVKEGYDFKGWTYGDVVYQPGDEYTLNGKYKGSKIVFAAVWSKQAEVTTVTTAPAETTTTTTTTIAVNGDANKDNEVNVRDCAFIALTLAAGEGDTLPASVDFNGDGKVNVSDAAAIANFLACNAPINSDKESDE